MSRIIVFGATGYTGGLTAEVLARHRDLDAEVVLAGRNLEKLTELVRGLYPKTKFAVEIADVSDPDSVRALVTSPDDVLISTVGPFHRWGRPAVDAAIEAGCTYVDSTGEPLFLRQLFESDDSAAKASGARLLPAFGYDYVPGNLAGALALRDCARAGRQAHRVEVAYFMPGGVGMSSGTAATGAGIILEPSYAFRDGHLHTEHAGKYARSFDLNGRSLDGLSVGGTEQFGLPAYDPDLVEVQVFIGAAGHWTRAVNLASHVLAQAVRIKPVKAALSKLAESTVKGSRGGPDVAARSGIRSVAIAEVFDNRNLRIARAVVEGLSPYDLTAEALAWAAMNPGKIQTAGTLAPTQAFDLDTLEEGCASFGLTRVG